MRTNKLELQRAASIASYTFEFNNPKMVTNKKNERDEE
jgi:hypothetical protein